MAYIEPSEFVTKMVDAGESKLYMSTKDTLVRAFMAGAILGLAAFCYYGHYYNWQFIGRFPPVPGWFYHALPDEI